MTAHAVDIARAAGDAAPIIAAENLGFVYPDGTRALEGVNLAVSAGQAVAIIGQNGSGKSTLVRHFNGLLKATDGRVMVAGRNAAELHVAELARTVGIAFQNPDRQIFSGRVRAEVAFGPRNLGLGDIQVGDRVRAALESVGLADQIDDNPYDLGFSRRKLLALASILAMGTPVVVLDEPTTGQDAPGVARVQAIVRSLAEEGRTVIGISHDMRFVAETFERAVVMRAGTIVADGSPAEVFAEPDWPTLASTYLEPPLAARAGARLALGSTPTAASLVAAIAAASARSERADR